MVRIVWVFVVLFTAVSCEPAYRMLDSLPHYDPATGNTSNPDVQSAPFSDGTLGSADRTDGSQGIKIEERAQIINREEFEKTGKVAVDIPVNINMTSLIDEQFKTVEPEKLEPKPLLLSSKYKLKEGMLFLDGRLRVEMIKVNFAEDLMGVVIWLKNMTSSQLSFSYLIRFYDKYDVKLISQKFDSRQLLAGPNEVVVIYNRCLIYDAVDFDLEVR